MTEVERFERWVKENPFMAEEIGARAVLATIKKLRRDLVAAGNRIDIQAELLGKRAEKRR